MRPPGPRSGLIPAAAAAALLIAGPVAAAGEDPPAPVQTPSGRQARLSAPEVLALADAARDRGDIASAEAAYRALFADPAPDIRIEARFRLAMMLAALGRPADAAILFRQILDQQPDAPRVRLELARVLDLMGDEAGARRALQQAQAGGLPPDVARLVDRYSAALRARRPYGASVEFGLAPDSNINRATRADTLGTVLGDFILDEDARRRSGVGLALRGQAWGRTALGPRTGLLARLSGSADLYGDSAFDDLAVGVSAGPEFSLGADRLTAEAGVAWRWYGGEAYSTTPNLALTWVRPLDRQSRLQAAVVVGAPDNHRNPLQDGRSYAVSLSYERALTATSGVGVSLGADRQDLADPGYAGAGGQISLLAWRDIGPVTVTGSLAYARQEADARLFLHPERRKDDFYRASLGLTVRRLTLGPFAPVVRLTAERNHSTVALYDYQRVRTEFALVRAF